MESALDIDTREVLACDESFFTALLAADHDLLGAIGSGQLRFAEVTRYAEERSVRKAGTPMAMRVKTAGGA